MAFQQGSHADDRVRMTRLRPTFPVDRVTGKADLPLGVHIVSRSCSLLQVLPATVAAHDDMELVGVADVATDWRIRAAQLKGYKDAGASIRKTDQALGIRSRFLPSFLIAWRPLFANQAAASGRAAVAAD